MDAATGVTFLCDHQTTVAAALTWMAAAVPASVLTAIPAVWNKLPGWLQRTLHVVALNLVQSVTNPPAAQKPPAA